MKEIERKWLLNPETIPWRTLYNNYIKGNKGKYQKNIITQQYLKFPTDDDLSEVRIRKVENKEGIKYYKTTKQYDNNQGMIREEDEVEISEQEFNELFDEQKGNILSKNRYRIPYDNYLFEIDIYNKPNHLSTVEVEFDSKEEAESFKAPCWFGNEVTDDLSYKNYNLARGLYDDKTITEIVLTGGACGGKSTVLADLKRVFESQGYKVLVSEEVATKVMGSGAKPADVPTYVFQNAVLRFTISNEKNMRLLAEAYKQSGKNVIIFYDRGIADGRAYCDEETWKTLLKEQGLTTQDVRSRYDAVYDIVTTAYGAEEVFLQKMNNNPERKEKTVEEARATEDGVRNAWSGHHHLTIFPNTESGWEGKLKSIFDETYKILGLKPVLITDKKYLVDIPADLKEFADKHNCIKQKIEQIYLKSDNSNIERRIRKISDDSSAAYYYTEKEIKDGQIFVHEKIIDRDQYKIFSLQADTNKKTINKTRLSFFYDNQYFALDVFPEGEYENLPRGKCILESKGITEENIKPEAPKGLFATIEEITNNQRFRNKILAQKSRDNGLRDVH